LERIVNQSWLPEAFLENPYPITFPTFNSIPKVSIIIPVHNNSLYTFNCLKAIAQSNPQIPYQIILIDDASTDDTNAILNQIYGIQVFTNSHNIDFIGSCNLGAAIAKTEYLCFLNNDTQVLPGWLENLVLAMEQDRKVGAVGSKLIYADGSLQEAGGVVWQDGSAWNYGKFSDHLESANEPEYNYLRQVDYCSAASLLVRTDLFNWIGGFSQLYLPAYYEDTDFCFAVRKLGYKVIYQPRSVVIHYEGVTAGINPDRGIKQYQVVNRHRFAIKWQSELAKYYNTEDPDHLEQGPRRLLAQNTILLITNWQFEPIQAIAQMLLQLGYRLILLPQDSATNSVSSEGRSQSNFNRFQNWQNQGIEVLYPTQTQPDLLLQLAKRIKSINFVWISDSQLVEKYRQAIAANPKIRIINFWPKM
jgi:O-antigen biosynthesis protein